MTDGFTYLTRAARQRLMLFRIPASRNVGNATTTSDLGPAGGPADDSAGAPTPASWRSGGAKGSVPHEMSHKVGVASGCREGDGK